MGEPDHPDRRRIRHIDWTAVLKHLDESPAGTPFLIGRLHRSVATQINRGDYGYINPARYRAWTAAWDGTTSEIWIRRNA